ncbi:MAG: hypothetical protein ACXVCE_17465 [Bacteriovorax sp.]
MKDFLETAKNFASKMDSDDFDTAKNFLNSTCEYISGDKIFIGPEQIMQSYKEHSDFAKSTFESVVYESSVKLIDFRSFEATYVDIISKNGKTHTYTCKQILDFDQTNKIVRIRHFDIPGEYDRLKQFYSEVGLS